MAPAPARGAGQAVVFLRDGEGEARRALRAWPLAYLADALSALEESPQTLESVVLPAGFFWPALDGGNQSGLGQVVGWSQPWAQALEPGATTWIGYGAEGAGGPPALLLGLDPWAAPGNIFHFAQQVLPAFAARVRLAREGGRGLLDPLPPFAPVVLADPRGASWRRWQRGLLELVTGSREAPLLASAGGPSSWQPASSGRAHCFRRAVLAAQGAKDHAATGGADQV